MVVGSVTIIRWPCWSRVGSRYIAMARSTLTSLWSRLDSAPAFVKLGTYLEVEHPENCVGRLALQVQHQQAGIILATGDGPHERQVRCFVHRSGGFG